jgi:integrase
VRGHVRKRGNKWAVVYDEGRDEHGRRVQRWRGGYATRREAEDALTALLGSFQTGDYVAPAKMTFKAYVEETWFPHVEKTRRPGTVDQYARMLRLHIYPVLGGVPMQSITPTLIDKMVTKATTGEKPLSATSARVLIAIVSSALEYAKKKKIVARNPARDADMPAVDRRPRTIWTAGETRRFLEAVEDDRLHALWRLIAVTGMRRGEALGLQWRSVDLKQATVEVVQQLVPVGERLVLGPPKTAAGKRTLPIDERTVDALRAYQATRELERQVLGEPAEDLDLVFVKPDGAPLNPRAVTQRFARLVKNAKLAHIRLHDLRHGAATLAVAGDVNLELLRRRMGHSTIRTTVDLYARHDLPTAERAAAETVANLIDGDVGLQSVSRTVGRESGNAESMRRSPST